MRIFLIDNYDSFTYNLFQYFSELGCEVVVKRNDRFSLEEIEDFSALVISPGPGRPENAGLTIKAIEWYAGRKPILGVCLGHQAIGLVFGGRIRNARKIMHGKISKIKHDGKNLFMNIEMPTSVVRYHSLVVDDIKDKDIEITAISLEDDEIMGIRHKRYLIEGIQFHPESVMTFQGKKILKNFLELVENEKIKNKK